MITAGDTRPNDIKAACSMIAGCHLSDREREHQCYDVNLAEIPLWSKSLLPAGYSAKQIHDSRASRIAGLS